MHKGREMFIELVELDQRVMLLEKEASDRNHRKVEIASSLPLIDHEIHVQQKKVDEAFLQVSNFDRELQKLTHEQQNNERKSMTASSQKEIDSLTHEKTDLFRKREELDKNALELLEEVETAQRDLQLLNQLKPEKIASAAREVAEIDARLDRIDSLLPAYQAQRTELTAHVPKELLERYSDMKSHVPNPVVPLIKECCSGCFHEVSKPELVKVMHGELITCKGCYRMIYSSMPLPSESGHNE